jgi:hypothetical protein
MAGEYDGWGRQPFFVFRQKLLGEEESVKRGVVMVKQPGLFSPKFVATSSHVFTQPPQNDAVEAGILSLPFRNRCFALPQLLYRWLRQSGIIWGTYADGFGNRVLRRIFGPKRGEVIWEWRKLHNEELNDLHSPNIQVMTSKRMSWAGHIARMKKGRGLCRFLVGKC